MRRGWPGSSWMRTAWVTGDSASTGRVAARGRACTAPARSPCRGSWWTSTTRRPSVGSSSTRSRTPWLGPPTTMTPSGDVARVTWAHRIPLVCRDRCPSRRRPGSGRAPDAEGDASCSQLPVESSPVGCAPTSSPRNWSSCGATGESRVHRGEPMPGNCAGCDARDPYDRRAAEFVHGTEVSGTCGRSRRRVSGVQNLWVVYRICEPWGSRTSSTLFIDAGQHRFCSSPSRRLPSTTRRFRTASTRVPPRAADETWFEGPLRRASRC